MAKQTPNIDYVTIETYKNFSNGIKQVAIKFPAGTEWVHTDKDYWTIVPKSFYNETEWSSPIEYQNVFDKWVVCLIRDIDSRPYFKEFEISSEKMMSRIGLEHRVFAFIKDSSELGGLMRFNKMTTFRGQAVYIQLLSHGVVNTPRYGVYVDNEVTPSNPDCFGHGKWMEVASDKAPRIWAEMYSWVLDKMVFIDRPCPLMLNCNSAYDLWRETTLKSIPGGKYDANFIEQLDSTMVKLMTRRIAEFSAQFFDTESIDKIWREYKEPGYTNDYVDDEE